MSNRIGALHLRYRSRGGTLAAAMAPHLDRLMASRLADAIDARLPAILGDDAEVIVIRELNAQVAVGRSDWMLDSRVVDRVGRASVDALAATLARSASNDDIVRFADQAEFVESFIVDLLAGSAWDRWYYGAFGRYRDGDTAATIAAVLEDHRAHATAVFGWLARRRRLDEVVALLGSDRARRLAAEEHDVQDRGGVERDLAPLMAAAFRLIDALGWHMDDDEQRPMFAAAYCATNPLPPTWADRRSLTAWVLGFAQVVIDALPPRDPARADLAEDAVQSLLAGPLDWLDADWIAPQLHHAARRTPAAAPDARSTRRVLTADHERSLHRLAEIIRRRGVRIDATRDRHALVVQLLAALTDGSTVNGGPDRALVASIDRIADAFCAALASGLEPPRVALALERGATMPGALPPGHQSLARRLEDVRAAGRAAAAVVQQLLKTATAAPEAPGVTTPLGGLFLLTRGLLDVRLHAMARDADVPFEPLKAALASWWFDRQPPFDAGAAAWIGHEDPNVAVLDDAGDRLAVLRDALFDRLRDQRAVEAMPDDQPIASIGWLVLRAWSRWLPGVGESSRAFLVRTCLQRAARVGISPTTIAVHLDPAPLDVVVEMAGYFKPIERVPWLNDRAISFTVRRSTRM